MTKLYKLLVHADLGDNGAIMAGHRGRLHDFLIRSKGDGRFLGFSPAKAAMQVAGGGVETLDFLRANDGIPLFSERFKVAADAKPELLEDLEFHPCAVANGSDLLRYYAARTKKYRPVIDKTASRYAPLDIGSGRLVLAWAILIEPPQPDYWICRDEESPTDLAVTQDFVDWVNGHRLKMDFLDGRHPGP